jgi:hypothetical protein
MAREVKYIYAGLIMVETKAIKLVKQKAANSKHETISYEAWRAMINIYQALLNKYYDFFLSS